MGALTLCANGWKLHLRPDLGGCISGLWFQDQAILRSVSEGDVQSVRNSAGFVMVPYSNRIGQAHMTWAGQHYALAPNFAPEPHAIHGVGWQRAWSIGAHDSTSATLTYQHVADASWPFAFNATQHITLGPEGFSLELELVSQAPVPAPVGIGWHPYFNKPPSCQLSFAATGRWAMNAAKLPTTLEPCAGFAGACEQLDIDNCHEGWRHSVVLESEALHIALTCEALNRLVVFTRPELDFIALEPVSHVNNALQLAPALGVDAGALGLRTLAAGERMQARFQIRAH